ncbi:MAG: LruC domain-containing protein, partial [Mucilaginibacter sp.]
MKKLFTYLFITGIAGLASCKKDSPSTGIIPVVPVDKIAPDGFNFKTSTDIAIDVTLRANNDQPLAGVKVNIYNPAKTTNGSAIYTGFTNAAGKLQATVSVASGLQQLVIDPLSAGLIRYATAKINGSSITAVLGGKTGFSGDIVASANATAKLATASLRTFANSPISFSYPSPYKNTTDAVVDDDDYPFSLGRPKYLLEKGDAIDASLLKNINASLPESAPLPETHPEYLDSKVTSTLNIVEQSDVWITYVSEGAGNKNTLAYYTYKTGDKPTREKDIKNAKYVFPNASNSGSGGGLNAGDKISLGRFEAGTSIAFILIGDAWTGTDIDTDKPRYFSDDALNPEKDGALKKHTVVLFDAAHELFLIGFEDLPRDGGSDNDFNDLVFYATSNPVEGISPDGVPSVDTGKDQDGDGVNDDQDEYPKDPERAYTSYFPSKDAYAQVAFEDNWPAKGDYDLNDLVIDYR